MAGSSASHRRGGLAVVAALVALSAYAGALGLMSGLLSLGDVVTARLPFGSTVLGGLALALIVAVPSTVVAWFAWHGDGRTDAAAVFAGVFIIGWIVVELLFIRELSFFHPTYVVVGGVLIWVGRGAFSHVRV